MQTLRTAAYTALIHGVFDLLFTTHDPNHALRAADRAHLLRGGERIAEGPVQQILTRERLEALRRAGADHCRRDRDGVHSGSR